MRSLFFTPKPEDVPEEPVSDRQPEENRADNTPDKHIKARRTKNVHFKIGAAPGRVFALAF